MCVWKSISNGVSANLRSLFNSNVTKISVIKWSQNQSRNIRSGVFGIAKNVKSTCFACIFQMFGYGPSAFPRPLYNIYFGHITIKKSGLRFALRPSENAFSRILCFWEHLPL